MLISKIKNALHKTCQDKKLLEVLDYALFPPGKLFRANLVNSISKDLNLNLDHALDLAISIEFHHAYTLIHDDLPSMDNDSMRRGKPSTHVQFGEWRAILAGDALLIASFNQLANINHPRLQQILKLMSWATGPKGLILGQYQDLSADGNLALDQVIRIHELKTGRLIQVATLGTYLLSKEISYKAFKDFFKLGRDIGISFQLLDDLNELTVEDISEHEKMINPFLTSATMSLTKLSNCLNSTQEILNMYKLTNTSKLLMDYYLQNKTKLQTGISFIEKNIPNSKKELRDWITNFV
jgi:geranylgeranyl pyrophosphate synthase